MADDWQKGDLALCVNDTADPDHGKPFLHGAVYNVSAVECVPHGWSKTFGGLADSYGLQFERMTLPVPADPRRFRKINPLTDEEREQFTADLNVKEPVDG